MIDKIMLERNRPVKILIMPKWLGRKEHPKQGPKNCLIEREDGTQIVRPFRGLRKPQ